MSADMQYPELPEAYCAQQMNHAEREKACLAIVRAAASSLDEGER